MAFIQINKLHIEGNNNIVFQDADGTEQCLTIESFVRLFTEEKEKQITNLERTIEDKTKIERFSDAEIQRLGDELTQLKKEVEFLEKRIEEILHEFDGKDLTQTSKLFKEAFNLFMSGQLDPALDILNEDILAQQEIQTQGIRAKQAETRLLKARISQIKLDFSAAAHNFEQATLILPTWANHIEAANFYHQQNDYQKAEKHYQASLIFAEQPEHRSLILNNLGNYYCTNQKMSQAEEAFKEALEIRRFLAEKNPDVFLPNVATTLNNIGNYYRDNQKMPQAEAVYNEALKIRRLLAEKRPDVFLPNVATSLNNLGILYSANQKMLQAEDAYNEALDIYRQLAKIDPDIFLPNVATTLNNLGVFYCTNQKLPQAEDSYNKALHIYRQLAAKNPNAFLPGVAMTLNNLGNYYRDNQKMPQAEASYNETLNIYRELAAKNPNAFLPNVAGALHNQGNYYSATQNMPQAEIVYVQALKIRRLLADKNPDAFLSDVAMTLNSLGNYYRDNQKIQQAEEVYNEALKIYRLLVVKNQDVFLPDLAGTLNNLGNYYRANNNMLQAEEVYNEALKHFKHLADKSPDAFFPHIAMTLNNLGMFYFDNQKMQQAKRAYNKALKIRRLLTTKNPNAFLSDVAVTLNNLGVLYETLRYYDKALDYFGEAISYRVGAILEGGAHFYKDWIQVLRNITEIIDFAKEKKNYAILVKACLLLAKSCDNLKVVNKELLPLAVSEYGNLSWWALYKKDYALSETAALRCLELDETQYYVLVNLGHSQILRGQYHAGIVNYEKLKCQKDRNNKEYKTVILEDLETLEKEGVGHPDVAKARKAIEQW